MNTVLVKRVSVLFCEDCHETNYEVCRGCEKHRIVNELLVS
jgi:hypothetical protein